MHTWVNFDITSTDGLRRLVHFQGGTHAGQIRDAVDTVAYDPRTLMITEDNGDRLRNRVRAGNPSRELVTRVCV
jgi:hypothetical protein